MHAISSKETQFSLSSQFPNAINKPTHCSAYTLPVPTPPHPHPHPHIHALSAFLFIFIFLSTFFVFGLSLSFYTIFIYISSWIKIFPFLPMRLSFFSIAHSHHCSSPIKFQDSSSLTLFPSSPSSTRRPRWPRMDAACAYHRHRRKDKVVVIMGATGTGKSRLSVDLATRCSCSEIINSDKMQVYRGLDITTNKIPVGERNGVLHHLLGDVDPANGEFSPLDFRRSAGSVISDISTRRKLPIVVGGSISLIHALLVDWFDPALNVFDERSTSSSISSELRYNCCFLWVDVSFPVLSDYLLKRVDDMLDSGMVDELAQFFDPEASDIEYDSEQRVGLRKAIGIPEFDRYFKRYPPPGGLRRGEDRVQKAAYEEAVRAIKDNTCQLAKRQIGKILRLKKAGWDLRRLDATEAFRAAMTSSGCSGDGESWSDIWERQVAEPSVKIVKRFFRERSREERDEQSRHLSKESKHLFAIGKKKM